MTVIYKIRIHSSVLRRLQRGERVDWKTIGNFSESRNVEEMLRGGFDEGELNNLLNLAMGRAEDGFVRTVATRQEHRIRSESMLPYLAAKLANGCR